jgi:hypothetical protein
MKRLLVALTFAVMAHLGLLGGVGISSGSVELRAPLSTTAITAAHADTFPPCNENNVGELWWDSSQQIWYQCTAVYCVDGTVLYYEWRHA